jgi:hypothetical protein
LSCIETDFPQPGQGRNFEFAPDRFRLYLTDTTTTAAIVIGTNTKMKPRINSSKIPGMAKASIVFFLINEGRTRLKIVGIQSRKTYVMLSDNSQYCVFIRSRKMYFAFLFDFGPFSSSVPKVLQFDHNFKLGGMAVSLGNVANRMHPADFTATQEALKCEFSLVFVVSFSSQYPPSKPYC